jgi:regulator of RNase E activity RraA
MSPLSAETLERLRLASTATLCTQLFKRGLRNVFLQGVARLTHGGANLVGPAYTLRNIPSREDLDQLDVLGDPEHPQRKSIETVPPGHVLVIDCRGERGAACAGNILITRLMVRGVAGLVADGPVRDSAEIAQMDIPVYCAGGSAPLNLVKHHAADANVPIGCGGVAVYPGDVLVGDAEGVVCIPRHLADAVGEKGLEQERLEAFLLARVRGGAPLPGTYPPSAATLAEYEAWRRAQGPDA